MASQFPGVTENSNNRLIIQLLGYVLKQLFTSVSGKVVDIYTSVNIRKYPLHSKLMYTVLG